MACDASGGSGSAAQRCRGPLRPRSRLDQVKLGVLVGASVTATAVILWFGLIDFGWLPRYTLPVAVMAWRW